MYPILSLLTRKVIVRNRACAKSFELTLGSAHAAVPGGDAWRKASAGDGAGSVVENLG
jgi:hypothetical protein